MQIKSVLILSIFLIFNSKSIVANNFTLQLLHFSDIDGNDASILENVENFSALVNSFKNNPTYGSSTLLVSSGDNLKPGPRFYAAKEKIVQKKEKIAKIIKKINQNIIKFNMDVVNIKKVVL